MCWLCDRSPCRCAADLAALRHHLVSPVYVVGLRRLGWLSSVPRWVATA